MSYAEEVKMACAPANARLDHAWARCVESARLARIHNQVSLAHAERCFFYINLARQLSTIICIQLTAPLYESPRTGGEICQTQSGKK